VIGIKRSVRVLLAKPGLDGHDQGILIVAKALMEAGMEVIYLGLRQTAERIVEAAIQEDADFIGMSFHSGAHLEICGKVMNLLKKMNAEDIRVIVGGIYQKEDFPKLKKMGIAGVFGVDTPLVSITDFIKSNALREKGSKN
jgi:methylmalonyl-CoA mutase C-terminal domain/subunit